MINLPYILVNINNLKIPALIDSGSQKSIINYNYLNGLNLLEQLKPSNIDYMHGFNKIKIKGEVKNIEFKINDSMFKGSFYIIESSNAPIILGINFLKMYNCEINFLNNILNIEKNSNRIKVEFLKNF